MVDRTLKSNYYYYLFAEIVLKRNSYIFFVGSILFKERREREENKTAFQWHKSCYFYLSKKKGEKKTVLAKYCTNSDSVGDWLGLSSGAL